MELLNGWTIDQGLDAHIALDYIEDIENEARERAEKERRK